MYKLVTKVKVQWPSLALGDLGDRGNSCSCRMFTYVHLRARSEKGRPYRSFPCGRWTWASPDKPDRDRSPAFEPRVPADSSLPVDLSQFCRRPVPAVPVFTFTNNT